MYPEPHIPADPQLRALALVLGAAFVVLFWATATYFAISYATARPAACDGYTAQECPAAIEASHD